MTKAVLSLLLIFTLVLSGCSNTSSPSDNNEIEELKNEIQSLKEENERLKQEDDSSTSSINSQDSKSSSPESATSQIDDKFANATVTVTEKNILEQKYSQFIEFVFVIDNKFDKDIKGIEGTLEIMDMFGKNIMSVNCDFTEKNLPANANTTYKGIGLDYNQFMDKHIKIKDTPYDNMIFKYTIKTIMFTDGEILQ